jgi:nucleotide-binding universal stress UspA family protein
MSFDTILIPVDFRVNTDVAIRKALTLIGDTSPSIHLLHVPGVISTSSFGYYRYLSKYPFSSNVQQISEVKEKLEEWQRYIRKTRPDISVCCWITYNKSVENAIIEKAKSIAADLIIIGKSSQHSLLPFLNTVVSSRIASQTGTAVLTVKPGAMSNTFRTVVVPVGPKFPEKKISILNSLGDKFFIHVRLLILAEKDDNPSQLQTSLFSICRVLKNLSLNNFSYKILKSNTSGWDILNYCRKVNADLLIVHPESETRIGWLNKHISDELPVNSRTQILAVSQTDFSIV